MLLVTRWAWALLPTAGTGVAVAVFVGGDQGLGMLIMLATILATACFGPRTVGEIPRLLRREPRVAEIRAYRIEHPGATIGEAIRELDRM